MEIYTHLSAEERKDVFLGLNNGDSAHKIARRISRHPSTIYREVEHNVDDKSLGYLPDTAHRIASNRRAKRVSKLDKYPELKETIIKQLMVGWSPEIIAGRMKQAGEPVRVSHETIYQFIYSKEDQRLQLHRFLLKAKPKRGKLRGRKVTKSIIPDRTSIHDRPDCVNLRQEFGHCEVDLTFCEGSQSMNIGAIVERKTRLIFLIKNQSKHACLIISALFNRLAQIPSAARKSLTFDNGPEFVKHGLLKRFMGLKTYFCDKHSPWQKGQVEQMNVMLHRYLPKKSDLRDLSHEKLMQIQDALNNRPRKCLGFKTPTEAYEEELALVALQT